jgi:hypothetical protein
MRGLTREAMCTHQLDCDKVLRGAKRGAETTGSAAALVMAASWLFMDGPVGFVGAACHQRRWCAGWRRHCCPWMVPSYFEAQSKAETVDAHFHLSGRTSSERNHPRLKHIEPVCRVTSNRNERDSQEPR